MGIMPEERHGPIIRTDAAASVPAPPHSIDELKRIVSRAIREAVADHRAGVRETLRLCAAAFEHASDLEQLPRHVLVLMRVCRALCLDGLGEGDEDETLGPFLTGPEDLIERD
jgi:hypothetical protein